jgi:hypothetical protein
MPATARKNSASVHFDKTRLGSGRRSSQAKEYRFNAIFTI